MFNVLIWLIKKLEVDGDGATIVEGYSNLDNGGDFEFQGGTKSNVSSHKEKGAKVKMLATNFVSGNAIQHAQVRRVELQVSTWQGIYFDGASSCLLS